MKSLVINLLCKVICHIVNAVSVVIYTAFIYGCFYAVELPNSCMIIGVIVLKSSNSGNVNTPLNNDNFPFLITVCVSLVIHTAMRIVK